MIESRTVFQFFETPDDADVFAHLQAMIAGFLSSRPTDISQDKFEKVADALTMGYPVSSFGSLNSSNSAALQANNCVIMPGWLVAKTLLAATIEDYEYIKASQKQPAWMTAICGSIQSPILVGHDQHSQIEHDKVTVGNIPIWDGTNQPGETVELGFFPHHYSFTELGIAQAMADRITTGVHLLRGVGDGLQATQPAAIKAWSVVLEAYMSKYPQGDPCTTWAIYDPVPTGAPSPIQPTVGGQS